MVEGGILVISIGEISMRVMGDIWDGGSFVSVDGGRPTEGRSVVIVVVDAGVGGGGAARLGKGHGWDPNSSFTDPWLILWRYKEGIGLRKENN